MPKHSVKHVAGKGKGKTSGRRGGISIDKMSIDWKRGNRNPRPKHSRSVNSNSGRGSAMMMNAPQTNSTNPNKFWELCKASTPGGMCIKAREPIGSVGLPPNTGGFTSCLIAGTYQLPVSPFGGYFPRLSAISAAYEFFLFKRFRVDFVSSQPTTQSGQLLMWADYEVSDSVAATSSEALSNISSVISNVYSIQSLTGLASLSRLNKFVTNATADINTNQTYQAYVLAACQGFPYANSLGTPLIIGEIMIDYEIEFFTPSQVIGVYMSYADIDLALSVLREVKKKVPSGHCDQDVDLIVKTLSRRHHKRDPKVKLLRDIEDIPERCEGSCSRDLVEIPSSTQRGKPEERIVSMGIPGGQGYRSS